MEAESRVSVELSAFADKHVEELFFGDRLDIPATWEAWTVNKIMTPRTYRTERIEQNMPEFGFDEKDARALMISCPATATRRSTKSTFRTSPGGKRSSSAAVKWSRTTTATAATRSTGADGAIRRYYEQNIENAPPILAGEGKKLQPEWFFDFIMKPMRLRPWLDVRMPTFGLSDEEASAVVSYFGALDGYELGPVVLETRQEAQTALVAHREQPEQYFDCYSCHPRAGRSAAEKLLRQPQAADARAGSRLDGTESGRAGGRCEPSRERGVRAGRGRELSRADRGVDLTKESFEQSRKAVAQLDVYVVADVLDHLEPRSSQRTRQDDRATGAREAIGEPLHDEHRLRHGA
jgi:hypothetical protein